MSPTKKYFKPTNDLSYANMAELYKDLSNNLYEKNADFVLPQNSKFSDFGKKIAFCQIINTWFRKNPLSKLRIYDNYFPSDEQALKEVLVQLCKNAELHTLLALSYGIKNGIFGYSHKSTDYTSKFAKPLEDRLIFDYRELTRISNTEHFYAEYYQIHPDFFDPDFFISNLTFYLKIGVKYFLKTEPAINEVSKKLFSRIESLGTEKSLRWLKEVQTYFYEIFDNTYQWGRNNWIQPNDENILEKSNRIFFISSKNFINLESKSKQDQYPLDIKLSDFFRHNRVTTNRGSGNQLLELSILDNGIGIVQTYKQIDIRKTKISITDEYKSLIEAFKFGNTSDNTARATLRGIGLNKVIEKINNVFLIIRTGHLHLYRDFGLFPFDKSEAFYLFDVSDLNTENKKDTDRIKRHPWSEGTLFTFIIPL